MPDIDKEALRAQVEAALHGPKTPKGPEKFEQNAKSHIKHVIGVVSGKGGVGKSAVTGILATELKRAGIAVGILDADVTGPSIPKMFGINQERAYGQDDLLIPVVTKGGIPVMSANLVLEHETDPVIWRGPVVANAVRQFYSETTWGDLDVLLVDMPPGTSDVALTVFQSLPIDGVVLVSSPQDLVQMVVGKAVKMAQMMNTPILGLVENMAYIKCPDCGKKIEPFGPSRLANTCKVFQLNPLGQLPIDPDFAAMVDAGKLEDELGRDLLPRAIAQVQALMAE